MPARRSTKTVIQENGRPGTGGGSALIQAPRRKSRGHTPNRVAKRSSNPGRMKTLSDTGDTLRARSPDEDEGEEVEEEISTPLGQPEQETELQVPPQVDEDEIADESKQTGESLPKTKEQIEQMRREHRLNMFEYMDLNGDGMLDEEELRVALEENGVREVPDDVIDKILGNNDSISFEQFNSRRVLQEIRELRVVRAQEDYEEYLSSKARLQKMGSTPTLLPDRVLRVVLEYIPDVSTLRSLSCTSRRNRALALHDDFWRPLLLRRKRAEQAQSAHKSGMLPEVRCQKGYYQWYLDWVRSTSSERGAEKSLMRMKEELLRDGEPSVITLERHMSTLQVIRPYEPPPPETKRESMYSRKSETPDIPAEEEAADDIDQPPPPPPPLPDILTGDEQGNVQIRPIACLSSPLATLSEHDTSITFVSVSARYLWCGSADCTVTVWPREDLTRPAFSLIGHKEAVSCLETAAWDERVCVTGSMDRTVIIWAKVEKNAKYAKQQRELQKTGGDPCAMQIHPKKVCKGHTMKVTAVTILPQAILSASRDSIILVWDYEGVQKAKMEGHLGPVNCLGTMTRHTDEAEETVEDSLGNLTLGRSFREENGLLGIKPRQSRDSTVGLSRSPSVSFQSDNTALVSACGGGLVKGWNLRGKQIFTRRVHEAPIETMKVSSELGIIITGSWDNTVAIFNPETGAIPAQLKGHEGAIRSVELDLPRLRIVSGSDDKSVAVWDISKVDMTVDKMNEKTIIPPLYVLRGPKTSIVAAVLAVEEDTRWHSIVAITREKSMFQWGYKPNAPFQLPEPPKPAQDKPRHRVSRQSLSV